MMDTEDIQKLRVLLPHWIKHNSDHATEFRTWARKAADAEVYIQAAAEHCESAGSMLEKALECLGGPNDSATELHPPALTSHE